MNCLIDYIGILRCGSTTSESGIYINSLPGVSLKQIDEAADADQVGFSGVWDDIQLRASRRFETKIKAELQKRYKISTIQQSFDLSKNLESTTTAAAAKYKGLIISLDNFVSSNHYVVSNFQRINVQQLFLYLTVAQNTTVKIFDAIKGALLDTFTVTGAVGWNTIQVNENYVARKLFIAYDSTLIIATDTILENHYDCCDCNVRIEGAESNIASTILESAITKGNNGFGLSGIFSSQCTFDALVCNNKNVFSNAWLYLLGIELMNEVIYTTRISRWTTVGAQKAKDLKAEFEVVFVEELANSISGLNVNASDCCLECNETIMIKEVHP